MAFCSNCGVYIAEGIEECPSCGKRIIPEKPAQETTSRRSSGGGAAAAAQTQPKQERRETSGGAAPKSGEYHYKHEAAQSGAENRTGSRSGSYTQYTREEPRYREQVYRQKHASGKSDAKSRTYSYSGDVDAASNKYWALLCYCGPLFLIPYFLRPESEFVKFHANQGLLLLLVSLLCSVVEVIPIVGWLASIVGGFYVLIHFFKGIGSVLNMRRDELPYIGSIRLLK